MTAESFDCGHCEGRHDLTKILDYLRDEGSITVSRIQRRFRLGYPHALTVFEHLVNSQIVSPSGVSLID